MKAKTLVQSWLEVELNINEKTLAEALRDLNKKLDSVHTHSRVREWEENRNGRGDRLPRKVRSYMAKIVIKHVLEAGKINTSKVNTRTLNKMAEQLC